MYLHEDVPLFGSFMQQQARLHFIENEGMAFGMKWDWEYGKLSLSLFRIIAVGVLAWFIHSLIRQRHSYGVLLGFALILAGASGNIIDSVFYGMVFEESVRFSQEPAQWVAWGEGYAAPLHGKVVDMFHFPLTEWVWPRWMPGIGGDRFVFFSPVFNIADAAITIGVVVLMFFLPSFSKVEKENQKQQSETEGEVSYG